MLEIELLHHYSSSTYIGLGDLFEIGNDVWQAHVVQEAFKHEFLLNGIFSLAAIHLASQNVESSSVLKLKASEYMEVALEEFRALLSTTEAGSVNALFAFAVVLSASTMVQLQASFAADINWSCLVDNISVIFECLHGIRSIVIAGGQWLQDGSFRVALGRLRQKDGIPLEPGPESALLRLKHVNDEASVHLSDSQKQLYGKIICDLKTCWLRKIFAMEWIIDAGTTFLVELRNEVPMARLILAHWGVSLRTLNGIWWANGLGHSIVEHSTKGLECSIKQFNLSMRWTRQGVGLDQLDE